jgi:hypothetical protein
MAVTLSTRLVPSGDVAFREIAREGVLLDLESGTYFGLNGVGTRAWMLVQDGRDLRAVHTALVEEYDVQADVLETDLIAWAEQLLRDGLVRQA